MCTSVHTLQHTARHKCVRLCTHFSIQHVTNVYVCAHTAAYSTSQMCTSVHTLQHTARHKCVRLCTHCSIQHAYRLNSALLHCFPRPYIVSQTIVLPLQYTHCLETIQQHAVICNITVCIYFIILNMLFKTGPGIYPGNLCGI
jgi:hypothetical protein